MELKLVYEQIEYSEEEAQKLDNSLFTIDYSEGIGAVEKGGIEYGIKCYTNVVSRVKVFN